MDNIRRAMSAFADMEILVLGDVMLDRFIWGAVRRISPEAPVPVVEVARETSMLGGAGNVLRNLRSLGARASLCGVVGDDEPGRRIDALLNEIGVASDGLVKTMNRNTTVKTRIVAHSQQVVRVDHETRGFFSDDIIDALLGYLKRRLPGVSAVIVSDYAKGVVNPRVLEPVLNLPDKIVSVDPKVENIDLFQGATIVTPNHFEAASAAKVSLDEPDYVNIAGARLLRKLGSQAVLITQGEQGMTLFNQQGKFHIPTNAKQVYDVTGAGDTVISTLTLSLAAGLGMREAAWLANKAAGIVVGEVGTSTITLDVLQASLFD